MHYIKIKTRVQLFMHDLKSSQQRKVFSLLNKRKIDYRYIRKHSCISVKMKDEAIIRYVLSELNLQ